MIDEYDDLDNSGVVYGKDGSRVLADPMQQHWHKISLDAADPEHHLNENGVISESEETYFNKLYHSEIAGNGLKNIYVHQNHKSPKSLDEPVRGIAYEFHPNGTAHFKLFDYNFGGQMIGSQIKNSQNYNDAYFKDRLHDLLHLRRDAGDNSIDLSLLSDTPKDSRPWLCSLGKNGFAEVRKKTGEKNKHIYYLIVNTDGINVGHGLKQLVHKHCCDEQGKRKTWNDVLRSREYKKARNLSQRNAQRILYIASELLGVELDGNTTDDIHAKLSNENNLVPKLALPTISNEYNYMERQKAPNGDDVVVYHSYTTPTTKAIGGLFHISDHSCNMRLYKTDKNHTNDYGSAFPLYTGLNKSSEIKDNPEDHEFINQHITWNDKNNAYHPMLFKKYKSFEDDDSHRINSELLNANKGYHTLSTVISLIKKPN